LIALDVKIIGDKVITAAFKKTAATSTEKMVRTVSHWAHILEARIKSRAPVKTGDYRRSWNTQLRGTTAIVGTSKPQARRLEFGFVGTDSLGRHYNQAPRPHVRPSIDEIREPFLRAVAKAVKS
jgi:hypothetical protein